MKTQISRDSRDILKRYSGVYQQQGRMITDADWNELTDLVKERLDDVIRDVIGSGSPRGRGIVEMAPTETLLHWGYVYVDGIAAQVRPDESVAAGDNVFQYAKQADFPSAPAITESDYLLYLDVWERPVLSLEDAELRDPGLHGADTTTRTQTMAQVKWCLPGTNPEDPLQNPPKGDALLTLALRTGTAGGDPCDPCADEVALPSRVGNYLFRVEVHDAEWDDASNKLQRLVLKWSSENGAEQHEVGNEPPGFKGDKWVYEFYSGPDSDNTSEKHLGVHLVGATGFPLRGSIQPSYPGTPPAGFSLVRRWDGFCVLERAADDTWALANDADGQPLGRDRRVSLSTSSGADAPGHIALDANVEINLDALVLSLELEGKRLIAGDFWYAPVREAIHVAGDALVSAQPPQGITHHYMTLASVSGGIITAFDGAECKRHEFPRLTDLRAKDVCYDNTHCDLPNAGTVQDAIDKLCQQRDLRFHNKHLHGWGIVCGLKVYCGPDTFTPPPEGTPPRQFITITDGYAIDCDGNDVVVEAQSDINLMARIQAYDSQHSEDPILNEVGDGTACLTVALNEQGMPEYHIEKYDPSKDTLRAALDGTLLMDFYQKCVKDLVDAIKEELEPDQPDANALVGPKQRRVVALLNLIIQLINPSNGSFVFLSKEEHDILEGFYNRLRELLQSKTFCAMFAGEDFPQYPFPDNKFTIFGKGFHTRLRVNPNGKRAYTTAGTDNTINVFDLEKNELINVLEMNAGEGAEITDVAISPSGETLFASAVLSGGDSIIGIAHIDGDNYDWQPVRLLCGVELVRLHASTQHDGLVYAIGKGKGLYMLRPEQMASETQRPEPKYVFNAVGQFSVDEDRGKAFATVNSGATASSTYDQIAFMDIASPPANDNIAPAIFDLLDEQGNPASGSDDLRVLPQQFKGAMLCVVVDGNNKKRLLCYDETPTTNRPSAVIDLEDTEVRLGYHAPSNQLLLAMADGYRLQIIDDSLDTTTFRRPLQVSPIAVASHNETDTVYALNFLSNTITVIPGNQLDVTDEAFNDPLEEYRTDALHAYWRLFGGLLQYLKDCFCDHLLVDCPTCDKDEDKLYLAAAEIRENAVYKVCNFSRRKYLKTLPTLSYWASIIPVGALIKKAVQQLCCMILPNWFDELYDNLAVANASSGARINSETARNAVFYARRADVKSTWREQKKSLNVYRFLARDNLLNVFDSASLREPGATRANVLDADIKEAQAQLVRQGVVVDSVKVYDRTVDAGKLLDFSTAPSRLKPGTKVTLYEQQGKVKFYTTAPEPTLVAGVSDAVQAQINELERKKAALSDLSDVNAEFAKIEARRAEIENLTTVRQELTQLTESKATVESELVGLKEEVAGLKAQRDALTELESRNQAMLESVAVLRKSFDELSAMHRDLQLAISRDRPVSDVAEVTPDIDAQLRDLGIRSIGELATASESKLATGGAIDLEVAKRLIQGAQLRLKQ